MATNVQIQPVADTNANGYALSPLQTIDDEVSGAVIKGLISEDGLRVSEAVYWEHYYSHPDFDYEWNDGVLEEKPMSDYVKYAMYEWLVALLREYLKVHPIARKMALEMGFRLKLAGKVTVRKPDLFVVRHDNPIALNDLDRTYKGVCDLCIESISDSTKREVERDTIHKKSEYADVGVREYFILDPSGEHTAFYQRTATGDYDDINLGAEGIISSEVLPGFQFRVIHLYQQPQFTDLVEDEVYRGYLMLEYQAERVYAQQERMRADQEHMRADQERIRAEQAHTRAERLAAKLRALGIEEETL